MKVFGPLESLPRESEFQPLFFSHNHHCLFHISLHHIESPTPATMVGAKALHDASYFTWKLAKSTGAPAAFGKLPTARKSAFIDCRLGCARMGKTPPR